MKDKLENKKDVSPKKNSLKFMFASIIVGAVLSIAMFVFLGIYMGKNSETTIDKVSEMYMQGMGSQVSKRYDTAIKLKMNMVEALIETIHPEDGKQEINEELIEKLRVNASARGFEYLAYYDVNGNMEMILGSKALITDPEPFKKSLTSGDKKVAVGQGRNEQGNIDLDIVFIGIPTNDYIFEDGITKSIALVAGISNADIVEMLNMDVDNSSMVYSHIIRKDGSFVIQSGHEEHIYENYYDQIRDMFPKGSTEAEKYINALIEQMEVGNIYSDVLFTGKEKIHLYCERLEFSEWCLVTIMDYDAIDIVVNDLSSQWGVMITVASIFVATILIVIFIFYIQFSRQNIKQLEIAREEAIQANKAKSEFLSNMSHDIRTPMNAIVGMTAIARANINNSEQVQDSLKKIALSSKHLLGLINDILDMSKIESGKMTLNTEKISLREILNGIATIVQPQIKTKSQNFEIHIDNIETETVYCDSVRLNQILLNLLSNAIKFTPEDGSIQISLHQEASPVGDSHIRNIIRVKDNGIGMSPQFLTTIFDSFTREDNARVHKTEGTGLGMAITKYIVDAMKGSIQVESEQGKGSTFTITLDLEKALEKEEEMILPNWHMLIVDDDEILCNTTASALKSIGVDSECVLSGEEAIKKVISAHDANQRYDVILMDWKLPDMDGIEAARKIREKLGDEIPILLISAYDWSEMEAEARKAGISGFISKPLFKSTLYYGLKKFVKEKEIKQTKVIQTKKEDLSNIHILLAEDNDLNWEIADMLLSSIGATIERAPNGKICVDMLKSSIPGTYDVILMDIRMPVMTGLEATVEIRKLDHPDKNIPIIAMTADAFSDDMKKCLDCGMNAHISKPIDLEIVKTTILKFLNE
ncbi:MAG: response regulator [Anaeroplasmataceae bacterium]|nr:response regulator [Anaeroplasmataceae bacterium]